MISSTARLDTTHSITNLRVSAYDGKQATSCALVEEHYLPKGDFRRHLILMNISTVELSREFRRWVITHMKVDNLWLSGDAEVLWLPSVIATKAAGPIPLSSWRRGHNPRSSPNAAQLPRSAGHPGPVFS